ncbi:MAG: hypothetical protein KA314_04470 [Chloroflexi bacterium]|nr:hypothetical protein [Chloroflexota bacterium]
MSSTREVREGTQFQGIDERIAYRLDVTNWGDSPTIVSVVVKDRAGNDVTSTVMTGTTSTTGNVITLPVLHSLIVNVRYRIEVIFTVNGNVMEAYFFVRAEV